MQGVFNGRHLGAEESLGFGLRLAVPGLGEDEIGQGLQAAFTSDAGACAAFGPVGRVQVFQRGQAFGAGQRGVKLWCQQPLFLNRLANGGAAFIHGPQPFYRFGYLADEQFVKVQRHLLAIPRDEGHGIAFIQKANGGLGLLGGNAQQPCNTLIMGVCHASCLCVVICG